MKIRDLEVNSVVDIPLVAKTATARETKAKKPFLTLELYDGIDTIMGNYWDWLGANIPPKNAILNVHAQVTEWQGAKQLNVKSITTNTELTLADFMPSVGLNVQEIYSNAYALMSQVKDDFLRNTVLYVLEGLRDEWLTIPGAKGIHHAYVAGTLVHCYSVACISKAIAEQTPGANVDLCTVGGMLHDVGKLFTYTVDGISIDLTDEGKLYDHLYLGASFIDDLIRQCITLSDAKDIEKLSLLRHIILSHHGTLEHGAVVTPMCIEAYVVFSADYIDAAAEQIRECSTKVGDAKWTDRIWALSNRPHLSTQYVETVMESSSVDKVTE